MSICLKHNPAKLHSNLIQNDGALGFFDEVDHPNKNNNNKKMSSDMGQFLQFENTVNYNKIIRKEGAAEQVLAHSESKLKLRINGELE